MSSYNSCRRADLKYKIGAPIRLRSSHDSGVLTALGLDIFCDHAHSTPSKFVLDASQTMTQNNRRNEEMGVWSNLDKAKSLTDWPLTTHFSFLAVNLDSYLYGKS